MLDSTYYFGTIRNLTAAFGKLFTNIKIRRSDNKTIKIPLSYGDRRHWFIKASQINENNKMAATVLPRMSFMYNDMSYAPERQVSPVNTASVKDTEILSLVKQFQPAPWDFNFELGILSKNINDGLQILEQILPVFKPQVTITVKDIPELGITRDVPITLLSCQQESDTSPDPRDRQVLMWTLQFTMQAQLYPPISTASVIKKVNAYIYGRENMTNRIETVRASVDPDTANIWDKDSNGNPAYSIESEIIFDSNTSFG